MAMSDATSPPADWTQLLYRRNSLAPRPSQPPTTSPAMFDPLPDFTAAVAPTSSSVSAIGAAAAAALQPGIEGRVSKPARRRSRASRRAPTTLLNTDTTNFRAMVQQFTGIPSGPYSAPSAYRPGGAPPPAPAVINYGLNFSEPQVGHAQQQQQQQQFQGQLQRYQQQYQLPNGSGVGGEDDGFLQGFGGHGGSSNVDVAGDGLFFDGMPSQQMMPRATTSTNNRSTDGYFS